MLVVRSRCYIHPTCLITNASYLFSKVINAFKPFFPIAKILGICNSDMVFKYIHLKQSRNNSKTKSMVSEEHGNVQLQDRKRKKQICWVPTGKLREAGNKRRRLELAASQTGCLRGEHVLKIQDVDQRGWGRYLRVKRLYRGKNGSTDFLLKNLQKRA